MNWSDLHFFLAVARSGSMAGAARDLQVEHTTVSRRLGALESDLGVKLFARGPSGLTLTAAGEEILPSVEAIADHVESIRRRVGGADLEVAGTVRLTIPESGNGYFVRSAVELRARHPELMLEILSTNRSLDLRRGEADVAVRFAAIEDPELIVRKVGSAGWSLYASRAYLARKGPLISLEDLTGHDLIGYDASLATAHGAVWLRERGPGVNVVLRGNSIAAAASAAVAGLGIAPLPCFAGVEEPELVRVTAAVIGARDILLVIHPDLVRVARVRAVVDFLVELFCRDVAMWSGHAEATPPL